LLTASTNRSWSSRVHLSLGLLLALFADPDDDEADWVVLNWTLTADPFDSSIAPDSGWWQPGEISPEGACCGTSYISYILENEYNQQTQI
jgi:hypothetical protein